MITIEIEYDRVLETHGYREAEPMENGGALLVKVDGNTEGERDRVHEWAQALEDRLNASANAAGLPSRTGNHHGFTVVMDPYRHGSFRMVAVRMHVRFSDGNVYLWIMPEPAR